MTKPLIAYHGQEAIKVEILAVLREHRAADELVRGNGYWNDGKGCAVGCTLKSDNHVEYEARFGIPEELAQLEDSIFEGLPVSLAMAWPERFMGAVKVGSDLSRVHWHLLHWLLTDEGVNPGIKHPLVREAVKRCADLMADLMVGKEVTGSAAKSAKSAASAARSAVAASAARSAAASVMWSARSAAESAESVMWSAAESAESVMWSAAAAASAARSAAESVMWSARSAAAESVMWSVMWSAGESAWLKISDKLIELIEQAPSHHTTA